MGDVEEDLHKILEAEGTTNKDPEAEFQCLDKLGEGYALHSILVSLLMFQIIWNCVERLAQGHRQDCCH